MQTFKISKEQGGRLILNHVTLESFLARDRPWPQTEPTVPPPAPPPTKPPPPTPPPNLSATPAPKSPRTPPPWTAKLAPKVQPKPPIYSPHVPAPNIPPPASRKAPQSKAPPPAKVVVTSVEPSWEEFWFRSLMTNNADILNVRREGLLANGKRTLVQNSRLLRPLPPFLDWLCLNVIDKMNLRFCYRYTGPRSRLSSASAPSAAASSRTRNRRSTSQEGGF